MSDIRVTRLEKGAWSEDVIAGIEGLAAPTLPPGSGLLADELLRCDLAYVASDAEGPRAVLLVARVRLPVGPERREGRYLGLMAARDESSQAAIMARFTADAQEEEASRRTRLVLFTATATALAVRTASAFWADVQPAPDGSFREELLPLADAARAWLGAGGCLERPFVLPGAAREAFFITERRQLHEDRHVELFRRLGIDGGRGGQVLLLGSLPSRERRLGSQAAA